MKKVLIATTALVATASVAAADVSLGGSARFGVTYNDAAATKTALENRFTLNIDATTESDAGVTFGARIRVRQHLGNTALGDNGAFNDVRYFARAGGFELGVGNIYGAMDSMAGLYAGSVGLTGLGWGNVVTNFAAHGYSSEGDGAGQNGVELMYSMGDMGVHVSHDGTSTEIAGKYSFNGWTVGAALGNGATDGVLTVGGAIGAAKVGLAYAKKANGDNNVTLSGSFAAGAATNVTAYIAKHGAAKNYGIGVSHDLGGGAALKGGIADLNGNTRADLGVAFKF